MPKHTTRTFDENKPASVEGQLLVQTRGLGHEVWAYCPNHEQPTHTFSLEWRNKGIPLRTQHLVRSQQEIWWSHAHMGRDDTASLLLPEHARHSMHSIACGSYKIDCLKFLGLASTAYLSGQCACLTSDTTGNHYTHTQGCIDTRTHAHVHEPVTSILHPCPVHTNKNNTCSSSFTQGCCVLAWL